MTFNSFEFAIFLVAALALHWTVRPRWRNVVILVGSYLFYGWWDVRLLGLLVFSTLVDYTVAQRLGSMAATPAPVARSPAAPPPAAQGRAAQATAAQAPATPGSAAHGPVALRRRRQLLAVSLVANLGVLAAFKYAGFFVDSLVTAMTALGLSANPPLLQIVLPIGISFYTFQTIAYTVDVYRGTVQPTRDLVTFAAYVAYFPQLVAGPIERAGRLLPQLQDPTRAFPTGAALERAISLIGLGLVQKVVLADGVAPIVNDVFATTADQSWIALAGALLGFAVQIYGDFAGYTNIARGVSSLFGIRLMANFAQPYLSRDIAEFWRRWHISLSTWLRDYLYIPLGGNHGPRWRTQRNLMITMLLGGLWHGAAATFLVWGGLHGLYLAGHRVLRGDRPTRRQDAPLRPSDVPRILGTFLLVTTAWAFFRADSVAQASGVLWRIVTVQPGLTDLADLVMVVVLAAATVLLDLAMRRQAAVSDRPLVRGPVRAGLAAGLTGVLLLVFSGATPQPFVYFQF